MTPNLAVQLDAVALAWSLPDDVTPTPEQRSALSAFTGWGGFAPAFAAEPTGQWLEAADRLDECVPAEALAVARDQVDTSFFTPRAVTDAVFRILSSVGFEGGAVLEPGCGSGAFMSAAPAGLDIAWTGVELDPTSARIARILHPNAEILDGRLEQSALRDDYFDAAVGNVPFSAVRVSDKEGRYAALHNYFTWRALDAVRPGGYVVLITSRHAMDSEKGVQALLTDRANRDAALIGAVRLPAGAFAEAGTDVVTDVLVLRKNDEAHTQSPWAFGPDVETVADGHDWRGYPNYRTTDRRLLVTEPVRDGLAIAEPVRVSRYWAEHAEHVAGRMLATGFSQAPLTVRSDDPATDIARAVATLTATMPPLSPPADAADLGDVILEDADGRKEGSFHVVGGQLHKVERGRLVPARASKELTELVGLRDLAVRLLDAESDMDAPDAEIAPLRAETRAAYQAYVRRFGHLNRGTLVEGRIDEETGLPQLSWRRPAMGGFRRDPDAAIVMALEVFDQESGEAGPAQILLHRVNRRPEPIEHVDTPAEALAVSLGETGSVDLARIAGLLDLPNEAAAFDALGDLVFDDGGRIVSAGEYLSGNVRQRLDVARAAGNERNVRALEAVLPRELGPLERSRWPWAPRSSRRRMSKRSSRRRWASPTRPSPTSASGACGKSTTGTRTLQPACSTGRRTRRPRTSWSAR